MAKLKDVAESAGVSIATASRVLNRGKGAEMISSACAERVRRVAVEMGYYGNYHHRSIRRGRADLIGFVREIGPPDDQSRFNDANHRFFYSLISGVERSAHARGNSLALIGPSQDANALEEAILGLRQRQFDGVVVPTHHQWHDEHGQPIDDDPNLNIALICNSAHPTYPTVEFDERQAMKLVAGHLHELGHRSILWIGQQEGDGEEQIASREQHLISAAWELGMRVEACRYRLVKDVADAAQQMMANVEKSLSAYLADRPLPTALACYNDDAAISAMRVLVKRGCRIPADVSVVGVDNVWADHNVIPLTTIDHDFPEMGRRAVDLVYRMIDGGAKARASLRGHVEVVPARLVVRESTGPARTDTPPAD